MKRPSYTCHHYGFTVPRRLYNARTEEFNVHKKLYGLADDGEGTHNFERMWHIIKNGINFIPWAFLFLYKDILTPINRKHRAEFLWSCNTNGTINRPIQVGRQTNFSHFIPQCLMPHNKGKITLTSGMQSGTVKASCFTNLLRSHPFPAYANLSYLRCSCMKSISS